MCRTATIEDVKYREKRLILLKKIENSEDIAEITLLEKKLKAIEALYADYDKDMDEIETQKFIEDSAKEFEQDRIKERNRGFWSRVSTFGYDLDSD